MTRLVPLCAALVVSGCYTPQGAFIFVDDFALPATTEYRMAPGDLLAVQVFQQEAMSARVRVRRDGRVSLPMVGEVLVAGRTPTEFASDLQQRLKDFINTPRVNVVLEEARPLTVSVVGEVVRPGINTLEANSGVLTAIAAAGGLNDFAHRDGIFVLRTVPGEDKPRRIRFTWQALSQGAGNSGRFVLQPGDTVVVE